MKAKHQDPLARAFVEDHRHLTRGFRELMHCLQTDDLLGAVRAAKKLDRLGGAHIEFEEEFLYPRVRQEAGDEYVDQLHDEHDLGRRAVATVLGLENVDVPLSPGQRDQILAQAQTAYDHAIACGSLLSHLTVLPEKEKQQLVEHLKKLRKLGHRWTTLPVQKRTSS